MPESARFSISLCRVERWLVVLLAVSTLLAIAALLIHRVWDEEFAYGFVPQFGHEFEENIQT